MNIMGYEIKKKPKDFDESFEFIYDECCLKFKMLPENYSKDETSKEACKKFVQTVNLFIARTEQLTELLLRGSMGASIRLLKYGEVQDLVFFQENKEVISKNTVLWKAKINQFFEENKHGSQQN